LALSARLPLSALDDRRGAALGVSGADLLLDDYWRMGLEGPPWGYQWVRYGPDLLLVSTRTGRIEDVIYGAFY
jgi:Ni/Co efflux regulator RcnB